jgi:hypothetical protein
MSVETKDLAGAEKKAFQDMLPPDSFDPDWKKQFRAMDRHTNARERARQIGAFAAGFAVAAFVPGHFEVKGAVIGALLLAVAYNAGVAIKTYLYARDLDRKLDEDVRVEKDPPTEAKA